MYTKLINTWREEYRESLKNWHETLNPVQLHYAEVIKKNWQGTKYIARNLPFAPDKLVVCPPYSALNIAPNQQHRGDYATGLFEGSSAEPVLNSQGQVTQINVILHHPRSMRLVRSLKARGYNLEMPIEKFAQSMLDIVAIHGAGIVTNDDGSATRAYIRPAAGPGVGAWGVSLKPGYFIEASNLVFRWGNYFPDTQRVYHKEGAKVLVTGVRRLFPITGKHASNYGSAAVEGALARSLQYDELMFLAPYCIKDKVIDYGITDFDALLRYGVLADGPGEEVFGVWKDNTTLVYPPMRTNRLGGTVLNYIVKHLAPALGLQTREQDITLQQIRDGEVVALAFAGNAVKVVPIGAIDIAKPGHEQPDANIETLVKFGVHPTIAKIRDQYADEISGKKMPSHPSLLTPVDLEWGKEFRAYLDEFWQKLGFAI